jgi:hypothetical protein
MVGIVLVGGVVLGLVGWLAMSVLPESDGLDLNADEASAVTTIPAEVTVDEVAVAAPSDAVVDVDRCEVVDGLVEVGGSLENTSGARQAFVVHLAVLFDGQLFDGLPADIGVSTLDAGDEGAWAQAVGSVDPEDPSLVDPECELDRVGLGEERAG